MLHSILSLFLPATLNCDSAYDWQIGFQDGATPSSEGIVELHDTIMFYLVVISVLVFWMMATTLFHFSSNKVGIVHKYSNHGTLLELVWTITPAFVLIAIAFPSFKLLYLMDNLTDLGSGSIVLQIMATSVSVSVGKLRSSSTQLTQSGELGSTIGLRYNTYCANSTIWPKAILSQLIGHLLGDGALTMSHTSITPCFVFTQTVKRWQYAVSVFLSLQHYCTKLPRYISAFRKGVHVPFLQVMTRSYPMLLALYHLFYTRINGKMVKVITADLFTYMDSIVLAYWAMDDGAPSGTSGFYLHTKGFTYNECYLLAGMLHYHFGLVCTIQNHKKQPVIYITAQSMPAFRQVVTPHFHASMLYKLNPIKS